MAGAANWTPSFAGAAVTQAATYRASGGAVDVYVAQFTRHTRGARLVGFGTSVAGDGWTDGSQPRRVVAPGGRVEERVLVAADGRRRIVWSWYSVRGERVDGAARIRLRLAAAAFGAANRSGVVLLAAECGTADCTGARERLREAAAAGLAALDPGATDA
jgi:EpsI family protein